MIFLGVHSIRIVGESWRAAQIRQRGEKAYKGLYTIASIVGFALVVIGYGQSRAFGVELRPAPQRAD